MVLWLKYEPQELVDTSNLGNEEWLSYRRRGIGGSDAAAILGISPWRTARDLYYDKLSVVKADMDENWVALEMGHLLENLVARIFAKKTGLRIFQRKVMFQHPLYPWMLADLDYLVELPDGSNAILEIKTTNYNARENWWYNGEEIVPVYYESQGRHYMSVMNLDRVYFCCLYGNNEDEVIIRHLDRDYAYESELIALEDTFWNNNVQKQCPPDYTESGDLILQSLQRWKGIDRKDLPPAAFGAPQVTQIHQYLQLQEEKNALAKQVTQLDTQMQQLKGLLVSELDGKDCATCADGEQSYVISYNPIRRQGISKDMAHCLQFINRKAREYLLAEMKDNGMEPQPNGIYGGDVPEDTCYDWAEEYFRDANAEEDEIKEEPFVPKPYPGAPVKSKRQPKKEKTKAETKTAKPEQVIQMPQPEKSPDEEQFSMFDLMGGMAG